MYNIYEKNMSKLSMYKKKYYCKSKLIIETYIIGYKSEGESIIIIIKCDDSIVYTGIIDCFETKDLNATKEILDRNDIKTVNFICWTHPDLDHSKGIDFIIDNYANKDTDIWIPENVEVGEIKCSQKVQDVFKDLKERVVSRNNEYRVFTVSDCKNLMFYNTICFVHNTIIYPLNIMSLAPSSDIIRKQTYMDKYIKNDRSIVLLIELGMANLLLAGDIENFMISRIPANVVPEQLHVLKIPHHGSSSSDTILDYLTNKSDISCSTVYRKGSSMLPEYDIMLKHSQYTEQLYCTGKKVQNDEKDNYGIVKICTDIINENKVVVCFGNADIWS